MEIILTSGEFDPAKQRNQVADFIVKRVSAIVLSPCDWRAVWPRRKYGGERPAR